MVKITIENLGEKELLSPVTTISMLKLVQENGIDWMHACGGKGRCTTCRFIVMEGMENLSAATPAELRYREMKALAGNERLACQTRPLGEVRIRVPDDSKLPHMTYSD